MKFAKIFLAIVLAGILGALAVGGYGYHLAIKALPQMDGTLKVSGLRSSVTVYRDVVGIPHIYAGSLEDAAFAQGFVGAQDRLWQMDIFRRNAQGELSEIFGEATLPFDEQHHRYGFREAAARAVDSTDSESRRMLERYAAGVNEFIRTHLDSLPIEFRLLGYTPRFWEPSDSLSIALMMSETLSSTWERDIFRAKLLEKYGEQILADLYPTHSHYEIPLVGIDPASSSNLSSKPNTPHLPVKTSLLPRIQTTSISWAPASSIPFSWTDLWRPFSQEKNADSVLEFLRALNNSESDLAVGSNNWVVNGAHSVTGRPLLANDPHLAHSIPSIWYQAHLHTPHLNVIGVTLAGAPGVVIGHNEHIAWGMTNLNPDVQDVYVEQFDSDQGSRYLVNGQWVEASVREERIKIKGKPDKVMRVGVTRHGPVMKREGRRGYALQWTALRPGGIGFPFLRLNQAKNWAEFSSALKGFKGPTQNFVYADIEGNIGFRNAGLIPIRRTGKGNVAVPGSDEAHEWMGYVPFDELPQLFNPPEGWIATANQRITGDSYPYLVGNDWEAPYRFARIRTLLKSKEKFSRDDFLRIQGDVYSEANKVLATLTLAAAEKFPPAQPMARAALEQLRQGRFMATPDNVETTLLEFLRWQLQETLWKGALGEDWKNYRSGMKALVIENQLSERPVRWLPSGFKDYDELIIRSLESVCVQLQASFGSGNVSQWVWASRYPLHIKHPLGRFWPLDRFMNAGPFAQSGTRLTVKQTDSVVGVSMRMVVDFSDWDRSYNNITFGASGQPLSPHYADQIQRWIEATSFPMLFNDPSVKQNSQHLLKLEP